MFGSSPAPAPSSSDMAMKKEAVMRQIQTETNLSQAQDLMNNSIQRCFQRCVVTPGSDLSSKDKTCLSGCFDKYLEAFNVVSRTYTHRVARERLEQHALGEGSPMSM